MPGEGDICEAEFIQIVNRSHEGRYKGKFSIKGSTTDLGDFKGEALCLLMVRPMIQDLLSTVTRFRAHKYVMTADREMFRQIMVDDSQTELQKILWRQQRNQPI